MSSPTLWYRNVTRLLLQVYSRNIYQKFLPYCFFYLSLPSSPWSWEALSLSSSPQRCQAQVFLSSISSSPDLFSTHPGFSLRLMPIHFPFFFNCHILIFLISNCCSHLTTEVSEVGFGLGPKLPASSWTAHQLFTNSFQLPFIFLCVHFSSQSILLLIFFLLWKLPL